MDKAKSSIHNLQIKPTDKGGLTLLVDNFKVEGVQAFELKADSGNYGFHDLTLHMKVRIQNP